MTRSRTLLLTNDLGLPSGGMTESIGLKIVWDPEHGYGPPGVTVQDVLRACLERLEFHQGTTWWGAKTLDAQYHLLDAIRLLDSKSERKGGLEPAPAE